MLRGEVSFRRYIIHEAEKESLNNPRVNQPINKTRVTRNKVAVLLGNEKEKFYKNFCEKIYTAE
jgi:hypothetical protein